MLLPAVLNLEISISGQNPYGLKYIRSSNTSHTTEETVVFQFCILPLPLHFIHIPSSE